MAQKEQVDLMRVKEEEFKTSHNIVLKWDLDGESAGTGALKIHSE